MGKICGLGWAPFLHGAGWKEVRIRHVKRVVNELFAPAAGNGMGWDVTESFWQDEQTNERTVGGNSGLRRVLGALPETRIQQADYAGHFALRLELGARIRDLSSSARSRTKPEARVQSARRIGRSSDSRIVSRCPLELCARKEPFGNRAENQWAALRHHHHFVGLCCLLEHTRTSKESGSRPSQWNRKRGIRASRRLNFRNQDDNAAASIFRS